MLNDKQKQRVRWWVEALRSGVYAQATGKLRDGGGYCCLGVACDVFRKRTKHGKWVQDVDGWMFVIGRENAGEVLPDRVQHWLGLDHDNPPINTEGKSTSEQEASYANDNLGWGFNQIADAIERLYLSD